MDRSSGENGQMNDAPVAALTVEQFLQEAGQLHQTWIRRFDTQHRRRPRPPEIEAERMRHVRRLQFVQRLQGEGLTSAALTERLKGVLADPEEARLIDGDFAFLEALLQTWQLARLPQADSMAAGATPPRPTSTVEFRW